MREKEAFWSGKMSPPAKISAALLAMAFSLAILVAPVQANWLQRAMEKTLEKTLDQVGSGSGSGSGSEDEGGSSRNTGAPPPPPEPAWTPSASPDAAPGAARSAAAGQADDSQELAAAEAIYNRYDFIPGDKVIFYDDFSDTDVGEFPRKWRLKGATNVRGIIGGNGVEVVEHQGRRFMRSVPAEKWPLNTSAVDLRLAIPDDMPEKFTIEFDAVLGRHVTPQGTSHYHYFVGMYNDKSRSQHGSTSGTTISGVIRLSGEEAASATINRPLDRSDQKVHRISISVNDTFVKAYIDHERVINDPDALVRPVKYIGIGMDNRSSYPGVQDIMITNFRVAAGGKDVHSALDTDGRIVTHGILFDTGSDRIRPESLPTLRMILKLLQDDPSLNFSVEGHTDNRGGAAINQPLSENRARAVKTWLESKGIAPDRLTARGWGQEQPMAGNDSPEGRANNRRVEFVKI